MLRVAVPQTPAHRLAVLQRSMALRGFGALLCAVVAAIHIAGQGGLTELADPPYKCYLFYALEIGGGLAALLLIIRRVAGAGWPWGSRSARPADTFSAAASDCLTTPTTSATGPSHSAWPR